MAGNPEVLKGIEGEHKLKHAETVDKSVPQIPSDVQIKKVDREGFLKEVEGDHKLKHADTVDKSVPQLPDGQVNLHKVDRGALLSDIKAKAKE